jgi:hypothetical protein
MGCRGPGNFEDDRPRDYLADVIFYFEQVVERVLAGKRPGKITGMKFQPGVSDAGEGCLIPTVAIITALHEALKSDYLPSAQTVDRWKKEYLGKFDLPNADFDWPEFKADRRRAIEQTFDRLLEHCRRRAGSSEQAD